MIGSRHAATAMVPNLASWRRNTGRPTRQPGRSRDGRPPPVGSPGHVGGTSSEGALTGRKAEESGSADPLRARHPPWPGTWWPAAFIALIGARGLGTLGLLCRAGKIKALSAS